MTTQPLDPVLLSAQYPPSAPIPTGLGIDTNAVAPDQQAVARMRHCDENVYNLEPESHFMRFAKTLIGSAGAGQLRSKLLVARLAQNLYGMHFFDLDRFYGSLFGFKRTSAEDYTGINPYIDVLTSDQWLQLQAQDSAYRSRIIQFGHAINLCPTPQGLVQAAEAVLTADCDIYEVFSLLDDNQGTYTGVVTDGTLYGRAGNSRSEFVIRPKRVITEEERYALVRTLTTLKPSGSLLTVDPNGVQVKLDVPLRGVAADSNYWEVTKTVTPQEEVKHLYPFDYDHDGPWELPRPPFRQYQGEAWSYIADVALWNAYAFGFDGALINALNWDRAVWRNGNVFDYLPAFGLIDVREIFYGRSVSDGVFVSTPYPGFYSGLNTSVSALYCDRLPVGPLVDYMRTRFRNSTIPTSSRFWATPARVIEDGTQEVFEWSFIGERMINHISFSLAHFPHEATVYFRNDTMVEGDWAPLMSSSAEPVRFLVSDSTPDRFVPPPYDYLGHPQHYGDNHWMKCSTDVMPVDVKSMRIVLKRTPGGPPVQREGGGWVPAAYSLGLFDLDVGYRVTSRDNLPIRRNMDFSTAVDIVGSRLQISAKEHLAKDLMDGAGPWKSDMLPTKNSVVNFYVDTRDSGGEGQTINGFNIDPLYAGPNINLYYSNDDPSTGFNSDDESVPMTYASTTGTPVSVPGQWVDLHTSNGQIRLDNKPFQFDPTQSWWVGLDILPQFYSNDGVTRQFIDLGGHQIGLVGNSLFISAPEGQTIQFPAPYWGPNQPIKIIAGYVVDPNDFTDSNVERSLFIAVQRGADPFISINVPRRMEYMSPATYVNIGGNATSPSNIYVQHAIVKMEPISHDAITAFLTDPMMITNKPMFPTDLDYTPNSMLRLCKDMIDPMMTETTMQYGIVGGPGEFWNNLQWQAVARDYQMQKGAMVIPPTRAKFFKFEISNLVPEQYEVFTQVEKTVSTTHTQTVYIPGSTVISVSAVTGPRRTFGGGSSIYGVLGVNTSIMSSVGYTFADGSQAIRQQQVIVSRLSPTSTYTLYQPNGITGQIYPVSISIGRTLPIAVRRTYTTTQTIESVKTTTKTGFVCGLQAISAYRFDFSASDDSSDYVEHYDDAQHLSSITGLTQVNNSLMSTYGSESTFGEAVSTTFGSSRPVRAVQFATMQTDPVQLLTDPNFVDTLTNNWVLVGDATGVATPNHGADITRTGVLNTYGSEGPNYSSMEGNTYGSLEAASGDTIGGLASEPVTVSSSGRVVASAVVSTTEALSSPLHLQLIAQDGTLLAESVMSLSAGETLTMQLSYTAGSVTVPLTYGAIEGASYGTLDTTTYGVHESRPITGPVTLRVVQDGVSADAWTIHEMKMWDDAISWEFSVDDGSTWYRAVDIRNNPNGVITFPSPGNQLRYRLRFYRDNLAVSGLHIKPWYVSADLAMLPRMPLVPSGPNLTPPPATVSKEPMFQPGWASIIPLLPSIPRVISGRVNLTPGPFQPSPRPAPTHAYNPLATSTRRVLLPGG